ncbi:hypothetical protein B0T24DRAFT_534594 [Lasiosphaeria ovina]|uniref:PHD-type domain-containing protein n=1 Tax=Lasiosphaeria ovina TaxID=92902 RepID=A0AAE0JZ63_9PEZI|nr:hypothetical protein B0T24DRAFT_534594 [Lasiosphaeria ovina]
MAGDKTKTPKAAPKKKKGTASVVKSSKRSRGGGASGKKGGKSSGAANRTKTGTGSSPAPASSVTGDGDVGGGGSSESDSGPYCLCRGPDNHRFMIACDRCEDWFHGDCIGMDKYTGENLVQKYICPNCTDGKRYVTRYKKMCSLEGCNRSARVYSVEERSIFCSEEHCQLWWEQLIATLPKSKAAGADILTQDEFMGLLDTPSKGGWRVGKKPFGVSDDFWNTGDLSKALTAEERDILDRSASDRHNLGEEIMLCKKMLQLIEMALKRRETAIGAGKGIAKDFCGYDVRLDAVGVTHQFGVFVQSPAGEAIFKAGRLDASPEQLPAVLLDPGTASGGGVAPGAAGPPIVDPAAAAAPGAVADPFTAGMCTKKKCKPHAAWSAILVKDVKHSIKELAAQAKEKLDAEARVRDSAASRFGRKLCEKNTVAVYNLDDNDADMEDVE